MSININQCNTLWEVDSTNCDFLLFDEFKELQMAEVNDCIDSCSVVHTVITINMIYFKNIEMYNNWTIRVATLGRWWNSPDHSTSAEDLAFPRFIDMFKDRKRKNLFNCLNEKFCKEFDKDEFNELDLSECIHRNKSQKILVDGFLCLQSQWCKRNFVWVYISSIEKFPSEKSIHLLRMQWNMFNSCQSLPS